MTSPGIDKFSPARERTGPSDLLPFIPRSARRILDCACGDGTLARLLKQRGPVEVVGISADAAPSRPEESLDQVLRSDLRDPRLPFADGFFDCIVNDGALPSYREPNAVMDELMRVLSATGLMLFTVPNIHYYKAVAMLAQGQWDYREEGVLARKNLRFFTAHELGKLFHTAGCQKHWCVPLVAVPPDALPRDPAGYIAYERIRIGPLSEDEYKSLRTETYLVMATKSDLLPSA